MSDPDMRAEESIEWPSRCEAKHGGSVRGLRAKVEMTRRSKRRSDRSQLDPLAMMTASGTFPYCYCVTHITIFSCAVMSQS